MNTNHCIDNFLNSFVIYDYERNLKNDILFYICENEAFEISKDKLFEKLWNDDKVTGKSSGSYTFSRLRASLNLVGNLHIVEDMVAEGFYSFVPNTTAFEPEKIDVAIRCFLLEKCLDEVLKSDKYKKSYKNYKINVLIKLLGGE